MSTTLVGVQRNSFLEEMLGILELPGYLHITLRCKPHVGVMTCRYSRPAAGGDVQGFLGLHPFQQQLHALAADATAAAKVAPPLRALAAGRLGPAAKRPAPHGVLAREVGGGLSPLRPRGGDATEGALQRSASDNLPSLYQRTASASGELLQGSSRLSHIKGSSDASQQKAGSKEEVKESSSLEGGDYLTAALRLHKGGLVAGKPEDAHVQAAHMVWPPSPNQFPLIPPPQQVLQPAVYPQGHPLLAASFKPHQPPYLEGIFQPIHARPAGVPSMTGSSSYGLLMAVPPFHGSSSGHSTGRESNFANPNPVAGFYHPPVAADVDVHGLRPSAGERPVVQEVVAPAPHQKEQPPLLQQIFDEMWHRQEAPAGSQAQGGLGHIQPLPGGEEIVGDDGDALWPGPRRASS